MYCIYFKKSFVSALSVFVWKTTLSGSELCVLHHLHKKPLDVENQEVRYLRINKG